MKSKFVILSMTLSFLYFHSFSQSDCDNLLRYGIADQIRESSSSNNYKEEQHNSCMILDHLLETSNSQSVGGGFSFAGFGLDASTKYTHEQLESIHSLYCESGSIKQSENNIYDKYQSIISVPLLDAYNKCKLLTKDNVIKIDFTPNDADYSLIHISISGNFKPGDAPYLQPMGLDTLLWEIKDRHLYDAAANGERFDRNFVLDLKRKKTLPEYKAPMVDSNNHKRKIAEAAQIAINFSDGSIVYNIPNLYYWDAIPYVRSPLIGEVITSVIDSTTFFQNHNRNEWMLANGQKVPVSAKYYKQLCACDTVPDLRGVFIRGKNYTRNDGYQNPEGDLPNGYLQMDSLKSHAHNFYYTSIGIGNDPINQSANYYIPLSRPNPPQQPGNSATANQTYETLGGAKETRPKNITLSYYVRINVVNNNQ